MTKKCQSLVTGAGKSQLMSWLKMLTKPSRRVTDLSMKLVVMVTKNNAVKESTEPSLKAS